MYGLTANHNPNVGLPMKETIDDFYTKTNKSSSMANSGNMVFFHMHLHCGHMVYQSHPF
jgi:hypothetical protein